MKIKGQKFKMEILEANPEDFKIALKIFEI